MGVACMQLDYLTQIAPFSASRQGQVSFCFPRFFSISALAGDEAMLQLAVGSDVKHGHEEVIVTPAVRPSWLEELAFSAGRQPSFRFSDPTCPALDHESTLFLLRCPASSTGHAMLDRSQRGKVVMTGYCVVAFA